MNTAIQSSSPTTSFIGGLIGQLWRWHREAGLWAGRNLGLAVMVGMASGAAVAGNAVSWWTIQHDEAQFVQPEELNRVALERQGRVMHTVDTLLVAYASVAAGMDPGTVIHSPSRVGQSIAIGGRNVQIPEGVTLVSVRPAWTDFEIQGEWATCMHLVTEPLGRARNDHLSLVRKVGAGEEMLALPLVPNRAVQECSRGREEDYGKVSTLRFRFIP